LLQRKLNRVLFGTSAQFRPHVHHFGNGCVQTLQHRVQHGTRLLFTLFAPGVKSLPLHDRHRRLKRANLFEESSLLLAGSLAIRNGRTDGRVCRRGCRGKSHRRN
jgi:hypothetical protein